MFVTFKAAPELGRLRVVSDNDYSQLCDSCALYDMPVDFCRPIGCCGGDKPPFHFVQVKPNDQQT